MALKRYTYAVAVAASFVCAWLVSRFPSATPVQAPFRLGLAVLVTTFLPGYTMMRALNWFGDASAGRERVPLAFGTGYAVLTVLCAISAVAHLSLTEAFTFLAVATAAGALLPARTAGRARDDASTGWSVPLLIALGIVVICGWILEPRITGEETVELISIRKILENPFISIDGIMPEPHAVPTYVITPYYFFVALVSKAAGLSMFAAYLKLRALYAMLSLLTVSALAGRLFSRFGSAAVDVTALGLVVLFVADPDPWMWPACLFPLVRRGAFASGVLTPVFMLGMLAYVARPASGRRALAEWVAPGLMLLSLLTTHAMDIVYAGFFIVAMIVGRWVVDRPVTSWRRLASFAASAAIAAGAYRLIHQRLAAHVYIFDRGAEAQALTTLKSELVAGLSSLWGISESGRYLLSVSGRVLPYTILGICLTPLLVRLQFAGGTVVWGAALIPLVVYCSSKLFVLLQLATSSEVQFVFSYFTLWGTIAFFMATFAGVDYALSAMLRLLPSSRRARDGVVVALLAAAVGWLVVAPVLRYTTTFLVTFPLMVPWITALTGTTALLATRYDAFVVTVSSADWARTWQWTVRHAADQRPPARFAMVAVVSFLAGIGFGFRGFPGSLEGSRRATLPRQLASQWRTPSVLSWNEYYPLLQRSTAPSIDLPAPIVEDLERLLPPLQTLIADPAHSFALPVVLNQHIVNPGHVVSTSLEYFSRYARLNALGERRHPIFNDSAALSSEERQFLEEYDVQYILVDPAFEDTVRRKLGADPRSFELVYERDGFLLYRRHP